MKYYPCKDYIYLYMVNLNTCLISEEVKSTKKSTKWHIVGYNFVYHNTTELVLTEEIERPLEIMSQSSAFETQHCPEHTLWYINIAIEHGHRNS